MRQIRHSGGKSIEGPEGLGDFKTEIKISSDCKYYVFIRAGSTDGTLIQSASGPALQILLTQCSRHWYLDNSKLQGTAPCDLDMYFDVFNYWLKHATLTIIINMPKGELIVIKFYKLMRYMLPSIVHEFVTHKCSKMNYLIIKLQLRIFTVKLNNMADIIVLNLSLLIMYRINDNHNYSLHNF